MVSRRRRTTHRSASGTKLYAVRKPTGEFSDIQTYKRAHGQDVRRTSAAERSSDAAARRKARSTKR